MKPQKKHHGSRPIPDVSERARVELEEAARRHELVTRKEIEELARRKGWRVR